MAVLMAVTVSCGRDAKTGIPSRMEQLLKDHSDHAFGDPMDWQTKFLELMQGVYGDRKLTGEVETVMMDYLLSDASYAAKKMIWMEYANVASDRSVPSLVKMLDDDTNSPLAMLIIQKADLEDKKALMERLSEISSATKISIINHLGDNQEEDAVDLLYDFTQGKNPQVAHAAFVALANLGTTRSASLLQKAFNQMEKPAGVASYDALLRCAEQCHANGRDEEALQLYKTALEPDAPGSTKAAALYGLFKLSEDPLEFIRLELADSDPDLRPDLIRMVKDLPLSFQDGNELLQIDGLAIENRIQLLLILAARNDPSIHPYAVESLGKNDPYIRQAALKVMVKIGTAKDVDRLLEIAVKADRKEKDLAVAALCAIPGSETDNRLMQAMQNASSEKLLILMHVAGKRNIRSMADVLLGFCQDQDRKVQVEAIRTLGIIWPYSHLSNAIDFLLRSETSAQRKAWEKTVYQLASKVPDDGKHSTELIETLKQVRDKPNTISLILILGEIKDAADCSTLKAYLDDNDVAIQISAIKALSAWPNSEPLNDLIHKFKKSTDKRVRSPALQGSLQLMDADRGLSNEVKLEMLGELILESGDSSEKRMIITGYGEMSVIGSLRILVSLMNDSDNRPEVEASIRRIMRNVYSADKEQARLEILKARELSTNDEFRNWVDDGLLQQRFGY